MFTLRSCTLAVLLTLTPAAFAAQADWITRSNEMATPVLGLQAKFFPEMGSMAGTEEFDTSVVDLAPKLYERQLAENKRILADLQRRLSKETDAKVKQDINIMIEFEKGQITTAEVRHANMLDFIDVGQDVFFGLKTVLDPRNNADRQAKALIRLKRYAGMEKGYTPIAELARARMAEDMARKGLTAPYVEELKQDLDNTQMYMDGIEALFKQDKLDGWQAPLAALRKQVNDYNDWIRKDLLPRARQEVRVPRAVYVDNLKSMGVDIGPEDLMERASADFVEVRDQMQVLAARIAAERHLPSSDYRDVIRELKKNQFKPDEILPTYRKRMQEIEGIIREHDLVTLPKRDITIRAATEAEAAQVPSPQMIPPRLIGNTGEFGEFVIPLSNPHAKSTDAYDDDSYDAATWTLASHEGRPGHDLQFSSVVEQGVSLPRALFSMNSANLEGWALYCEAMMMPYMPEEGQLISLQARLHRMARAFLDPMVNLGKLTPAQAKTFLMKEVVLSEPFAQQEVDRYAFQMPGQATSYYYGYTKLRAMRTEAEIALGDKFKLKDFNDFVVSQGILPPSVMHEAVMEEFVPSKLGAATASPAVAAK